MSRPRELAVEVPAESHDDAEAAARLRVSVTRLARLLRHEAGSGLTPSQHAVLASVKRLGTVTLGVLAEAEGVAPPSITRAVGRLEAAGLLERRPDGADRRVVRVALTPAGSRVLDQAKRRKTTWLIERVRSLSATDRRHLDDALDVLEQLAGRERA